MQELSSLPQQQRQFQVFPLSSFITEKVEVSSFGGDSTLMEFASPELAAVSLSLGESLMSQPLRRILPSLGLLCHS